MVLGDVLVKNRINYPDKPAMKFNGHVWSYQELDILTNQVANGLRRLGVQKGDRVGLLMLNSPYFVISYFGITKLGAVVVPINVMFKGQEVSYLLNDSKAVALITTPEFMPVVTGIRAGLETVKNVIIYSNKDNGEFQDTLNMEDFLAEQGDMLNLDYHLDENDVAVYLYTSGTTGSPKGAMLTHHNLVSNAAATGAATETTENDITLCVLPMFHSFAWTVCVMLPLYTAGTIVIMDSFVPQAVFNTIVEEKVSIFAGVPTMYSVLLQVPGAGSDIFKTIRLAYSGGASLPVEVLKKVKEKFGVVILEGYGLSECSPVCTINPYRGERKPGSIGVALPGVQCKIVDKAGKEVPRNTPGELIVKGPNVMHGYFNLPEATAEALKDGWMYTGDIAYMDADEYLFIVDRKKDLIIVGGLNVYPREIEEVLYTHPKVAEAAVLGISDNLRGEMVKAFIALKKGESATERELIRYCQERLANYKLPKKVEFIEALPKTSTGKILKRALKN